MNILLKNDILHAPSSTVAHKSQIHSYGYKQTQMMSKIKSVLTNSKRYPETPFETEPSTSTTPQSPTFSFRKTSDGIQRIKSSRLATRSSLSLCPITRNSSQLNSIQSDQTLFQTDRTLSSKNTHQLLSPRNILNNTQQHQKSTSHAPPPPTQIFSNMIQSSRLKKTQPKCFQQSPLPSNEQLLLHVNSSQPISFPSNFVTCSTQSDHPITESTILLTNTTDNFKIHQSQVSSKQSLEGDTLKLQVNMNPLSPPKEHSKNEMSAMIKKHRKYSMQAMASMRRKNELLRQFLFLNSKAINPPQQQKNQESQQEQTFLSSTLMKSPSVKDQISLRPKTPSMNLYPINSSSSAGFTHFSPFQQHHQYSQIINSSLSPRFDSHLLPQTQSQSNFLTQQIKITSPKIITSFSNNQLLKDNNSNSTSRNALRRIKPQTQTGFSSVYTQNSFLQDNSENKQILRTQQGYSSTSSLQQLSKTRYASNGICRTEVDERSSKRNDQKIYEKCDKGEQTAEGDDIIMSCYPFASQMMFSNPLELQYIETLDFTDNHQQNQGDFIGKVISTNLNNQQIITKDILKINNNNNPNIKNNHDILIDPKEIIKKNNSVLLQQLKNKAQESVNQQQESQAQMQTSNILHNNVAQNTINRVSANHENKLLGYGIIQSENHQKLSYNVEYQQDKQQQEQQQPHQQFQVLDLQKGMIRGWSFSVDLDQQHQGVGGIFEVDQQEFSKNVKNNNNNINIVLENETIV